MGLSIDRENVIRVIDELIFEAQKAPTWKAENALRCIKKELLKEQEAVKPIRDKKTGRVWLCGNCGSYVGFEDNDPHDPNEFDKYCRQCGREVRWE